MPCLLTTYNLKHIFLQGPISNWRRLTTFLRAGIEQSNGAILRSYKWLKHLDARAFHTIGVRNSEKYFERYLLYVYHVKMIKIAALAHLLVVSNTIRWLETNSNQWLLEQAENCWAYMVYLGAVQQHNRCHAKFYRRLPDWLQVMVLSVKYNSSNLQIYTQYNNSKYIYM